MLKIKTRCTHDWCAKACIQSYTTRTTTFVFRILLGAKIEPDRSRPIMLRCFCLVVFWCWPISVRARQSLQVYSNCLETVSSCSARSVCAGPQSTAQWWNVFWTRVVLSRISARLRLNERKLIHDNIQRSNAIHDWIIERKRRAYTFDDRVIVFHIGPKKNSMLVSSNFCALLARFALPRNVIIIHARPAVS